MTPSRAVPSEVAESIGYYVYVYRDPATGAPFYIGKGEGGRALQHLREIGDGPKIHRIRELEAAGTPPRIEVLRYGLTEAQAFLVEVAAIDLIGIGQLLNKVRGQGPGLGSIDLDELVETLRAKPVDVTERAILITINRLYRSGMSDEELYEATRAEWKTGKRRERAEVALAVYRGVVKAVYRIRAWYPAGTLSYRTRDSSTFRAAERWEFEGDRDEALEGKYKGGLVGLSGQNPIRYRNV